jgi:LemA protein
MAIPLGRIVSALYPDRFPGRGLKKVGSWFRVKRLGLIVFVVLFLIHLVFLLYYNTFLSLQYNVEEARAQVDTQLQRRRNIILSMNVMVIDYAKHEREIFTHAADTRKEMLEPSFQALSKDPPGEAGDLEALLSRIFAVAERYPDLRLSENFQRFMDALVDVESKVAEERMAYNTRANIMSTTVGKFPGLVFSWIYGFEAPPFFEPDPEAQKPPQVGDQPGPTS